MSDVDVTIGGLGFRLAISNDNPYTRSTGEIRKQQFDASAEPGEQSLSQWWVRTQDSWHRGAGVNFYDPGSDETTRYRYRHSVGVDVWTEGQLSLLPDTELTAASSGDAGVCGGLLPTSGTPVLYAVAEGVLARYTDAGLAGTYTSAYTATGAPVLTGQRVLTKSPSGILAAYTDIASFGTTLALLWSHTSAPTALAWAKHRIVAGFGSSLYSLTTAGGTIGSQTPIFTHPDSTWTWTAVAEAPGAILAAGYDDSGSSAIYRFVLQDTGSSGSLPVLGTGIQCAEFPTGEKVYSLVVHLGTYCAIGTSLGIRLGTVNDAGQIQYGPLNVQTTTPVRGLCANGSFVYGCIEGQIDEESGLVRIDLSESTGDLRFAWAWDIISTGAGGAAPTSCAILHSFDTGEDRAAFAVPEYGVVLASKYNRTDTAYLLTGRLRYATTEPKNFTSIRVRDTFGADDGNGNIFSDGESLDVSVAAEDGDFVAVATLDPDSDQSEDLDLGLPGRYGYIEVRVDLHRNDISRFGKVEILSVKALPMPKLPRVIQYPLMVFDDERTKNGIRAGTAGSAWDKIEALELMQEEQAFVTVVDSTNGETYQGHVTDVQFVRDAGPTRTDGNFGGRVRVVVTKL